MEFLIEFLYSFILNSSKMIFMYQTEYDSFYIWWYDIFNKKEPDLVSSNYQSRTLSSKKCAIVDNAMIHLTFMAQSL